MKVTPEQKVVLKDALSEFINARIPIGTYVANRYKDQDASFIAEKVNNVKDRIQRAEHLKLIIEGQL